MSLKILSGSANLALAENVAAKLGTPLARRIVERFPDGELHIELQESVRGDDVFIIQPTAPNVDEHLFELLLLSDACRHAGAGFVTAVVPYFGYARQDRRSHGREPLSARLIADIIGAGGIQRLVAVDLHSHAVESAFEIPVEHLSAVSILADAVRPFLSANTVIVSPDLGAGKLAEHYAKFLEFPVAIVHKTRLSGTKVKVQRIMGDVRGKEVLLVDDMISTGGTVEEAIKSLLSSGCSPSGLRIAATHGLFVGPAAERLRSLPVEKIYVSNSVLPPESFPLPLEVLSIVPLLAQAIQRLHANESLADLINRY